MNSMPSILTLLPATLLLCSTVAAQVTERRRPEILDAVRTSNCEFASESLDQFAQGTDLNKKIIIIAYTGERETAKDIDLRRLHNARIYIVEMYKQSRFARSPSDVIVGRAIDRAKEGQLDFYADGMLKLSMRFLPNRDLKLSPCYVESGDSCDDDFKKLFYPCLDNSRRGFPKRKP